MEGEAEEEKHAQICNEQELGVSDGGSYTS